MLPSVAVVGATGAVGDLIRKVLVERDFKVKSIKFLASEKSAGKSIEFAGNTYQVEPIRPEAFAGVQIVLSSTPSSISREYGPIAARAGAIVVDNSSAWRMDPDVPLVVPEVNADQLKHIKKGIVANPNCVAIPLCVALKPLHDIARVRRVVVSTYQSSSGKGAKGLHDFETQLGPWVKGEAVPKPSAHRAQLAGNVITLDWTLDPNGYTEEENKVINETRKILGDQTIGVSPTCVRVPVKVSHSESVNVEFERPITVEQAKAALLRAPGVVLMDEMAGEFPQPLHATGSDQTFVGRVRSDPSNSRALNLWVVADNLRKGAATNAVQCAEELLRQGIIKQAMRNLKLTLAYDGADFNGWQIQPGYRTVQEVVEKAIEAVTGRRPFANASGRTDSGVHAVGQVVNFYSDTRLEPIVVVRALNAHLPQDVSASHCCEVGQAFDANKDALRKLYRYVINDSPVRSPFLLRYATHSRQRLDAARMAAASRCLLGRHDFHSFETEWPNRLSSVRTITHLSVNRLGDCIWLDVEADGFLYNMVRAIAGTLMNVGRGYWPVEKVESILTAEDRREAGPTAPAQGLFLMRVTYPDGVEKSDA